MCAASKLKDGSNDLHGDDDAVHYDTDYFSTPKSRDIVTSRLCSSTANTAAIDGGTRAGHRICRGRAQGDHLRTVLFIGIFEYFA